MITLFSKNFKKKIGSNVPISIISKILHCDLENINKRKWFVENLNINPEFIIFNDSLRLNDYKYIPERKYLKNEYNYESYKNSSNENDKSSILFQIESLKWDLKDKIGTYCYVLKLENDCFYIGISSSLKNRISHHFANNGAKWTKINKPIEIEDIFKIRDQELIEDYYLYLPFFNYTSLRSVNKNFTINELYFEAYVTFIFIIKYGFDKIRGSLLNKPNINYENIYSDNIDIFKRLLNEEIITDDEKDIWLKEYNKKLSKKFINYDEYLLNNYYSRYYQNEKLY